MDQKKTNKHSEFWADRWGWDPLSSALELIGVFVTLLGFTGYTTNKIAILFIFAGLFAMGFGFQRAFLKDFDKASRQLTYYMLKFPAAITNVRMKKQERKGDPTYYHIYYKCKN